VRRVGVSLVVGDNREDAYTDETVLGGENRGSRLRVRSRRVNSGVVGGQRCFGSTNDRGRRVGIPTDRGETVVLSATAVSAD
jgi:hypothetical protein